MFQSFKNKLVGIFQQDPRSLDSSSRPGLSSSKSGRSSPATRGKRVPPSSTTSRRADNPYNDIPSVHRLYARRAASQNKPSNIILNERTSSTDPASSQPSTVQSGQNLSGRNDAVKTLTPRYVPYLDASAMTRILASGDSTLPPSYYSSPNPSLAGGFGDDLDPPPLYDWVDLAPRQRQQNATLRENDQEIQPYPLALETPQRAFSYGTISADILADFDPPGPSAEATTTGEDLSTPAWSLPPPRAGYRPIAASILDDFDPSPFSPQSTGGSTSTVASTPPVLMSPPTRPRSGSNLLGFNNPYVALLEQKEQAMTVAFLRNQEAVSGSRSGDLAADDFSFGQRYHRAADTTDVVVTRQRLPANDLGGSRECPICAETKDALSFPILSVTPACTHPPEACLECLQVSIKCDLDTKLWTDIRCPECRELLEYVDIQKYADAQTFARYEALALRAAMAEASNFVWCTANCGSGQIHETGADFPIVTCLHCSHRSCFTHNVSWHENLTCGEYDALLEDPENFRSRIERENDEMEVAKRAQEDADRAMAQGLMAEQQADIHRQQANERAERERQMKVAALARKVAARRKAEEQQSRATVKRTTKPCPGCGWAIEKNAGCSHMTCIKCRFEFCWGCDKTWARGHNVRCDGAVYL